MAVHEDRAGVLWVGTFEGVYQFDREKKEFISIKDRYPYCKKLLSNRIYTILEDRVGDLWFGTFAGLCKLSRDRLKASAYKAGTGGPHSLSSDFILCLYEDRSEVFWIGTYSGIDKFDNKRTKFLYYPVGNTDNGKGNYVYNFFEDDDKNLWITSFRGGLKKMNRKTGKTDTFFMKSHKESNLNSDDFLRMHYGGNGILWLGTAGNSLKCFDIYKNTFIDYPYQEKVAKYCTNIAISSIIEESQGILWLGTENGVYRFNNTSGDLKVFKHDPANPGSISHHKAYCVYIDRKNQLWVGTYGGGLNKYNSQTETFTHYRNIPGDPTSLSRDKIYILYEDRAGNFWVGTNSGGLDKFDRQAGTFSYYTKADGLPNNVIFGILEDEDANLWISTNKGISRFNPRTETFKNYDLSDGIQGYEFSFGAYYKSSGGEMFFGGANGLNAFFPKRIEDNLHIPPVGITDFKIANRSVPVRKDSPLKKHISEAKSIRLSYKDSTFSFDFAALDFTAPETNQYKYMMEGFSDQWIHLGNKSDITFTNLDPGTYTFRVMGSNNDGIWNPQPAELKIIIVPPFWKTWWFQVIAVLVLALLLLSGHHSRMKRLRLRYKSESEMHAIFTRYKISNREQEIIQLIMKGKSNKEIEDELFISIRTVKSHIYKIYQKLGVKNRLELINSIQKSLME
jgi:DNA-binding CsgD family transcriptional regulator/streptogramin lyase